MTSRFSLPLLALLLAAPPVVAGPAKAKNVIFLLTDGTGPEAWPLTRWVTGGPLVVDQILTGAVRTYGADSVITDSAPGATAYATGFKGSDKGISVAPWSITIDAAQADPAKKFVPLATLLEGARLTGRATGIIATSNVQHATPAAFSSHWHDRGNYNEIAEQQVYEEIDVVLSGGSQYLLPKSVKGGKREDGENLLEVIQSKGYAYVTTRDAMLGVRSGKVWGAFAPDAMAYDVDRADLAKTEPALAEMTSKAIELLAGSAKGRKSGFFLFIEGSKTDWAAHADDPAGVVSEVAAFDKAVGTALDFARKDKKTLVVVVSDHGTGGLSIGTATDKNYSFTDDDSVVGPMRKAKKSAEGLDMLLQGEPSPDRVKAVMAAEWGIGDLSESELKSIVDLVAAKKPTMPVTVGMLSRRARLGWTTGGHTGADVFLFSYGPGRLAGLMENTGVSRAVAGAMGVDFGALNRRLFVDAQEAFGDLGYQTVMKQTEPGNFTLFVTKGESAAELPVSKNLLEVGGRTVELEGLVVRAEKLDKVFVPRQAVDLVKAELK
ncbi:MAG TPA: alkaline phosphatase [Holophaga sp.]|nr:alkaline phosphatase [Holophaga sp.]HPS67437.1 alkaline phosphatase [Holophaga sp.]